MYVCNGILFNHESPRRGETFVTRKISMAMARIKLGLQDCLYLGNLDAKRDWGHASDYVEAQWLMLQQEQPRDLVIATGQQFSVRDFVSACAEALDVTISWSGRGLHETATCEKTGREIVRVDPRYFRPTEVETLLGDPSLARQLLNWQPKISFSQLVTDMVHSDLQLALMQVEKA